MQKFKNLLKLFGILLICIVSISIPVYAGVDKPTSTWDLSSKGRYNFSGEAYAVDLYTNYYLTGKSSVTISITNKSTSKSMKAKLFEKSAWFISESTVTVPANGTTTWTVSGLDKSAKYYIQFYNPCYFSGYIK